MRMRNVGGPHELVMCGTFRSNYTVDFFFIFPASSIFRVVSPRVNQEPPVWHVINLSMFQETIVNDRRRFRTSPMNLYRSR